VTTTINCLMDDGTGDSDNHIYQTAKHGYVHLKAGPSDIER